MPDKPVTPSARISALDFKALITAVKAVASRRPLYWPYIQLDFVQEGKQGWCVAYACSTTQVVRHRVPAHLDGGPFTVGIEPPRAMPRKDEEVTVTKSEDAAIVSFPGVTLDSHVDMPSRPPKEMFLTVWRKGLSYDIAVNPEYLAKMAADMKATVLGRRGLYEPVHISVTGATEPMQMQSGDTQSVLLPIRDKKAKFKEFPE